MGIGGISIWSILLILLIVILLFGTKKLRNVGSDLGGAIKSFKKAVKEEEESEETKQAEAKKLEQSSQEQAKVIEGEATRDKDKA